MTKTSREYRLVITHPLSAVRGKKIVAMKSLEHAMEQRQRILDEVAAKRLAPYWTDANIIIQEREVTPWTTSPG